MDLIYTDKNKEDVGVILDYSLDLAFGQTENDFALTVPVSDHCVETGTYVYIDGTEYGGIVDSLQVDSGRKTVEYGGRTWHGVLDTKVILPLLEGETSGSGGVEIKIEDDSGVSYVDKYLVLSGETNAVIRFLISRMSLSDLFVASSEDSGVSVSGYKFDRYTTGYAGIRKMLSSVGCKLRFVFDERKVVLSSVPVTDYSDDEEFDSDVIEFKIKKNDNAVNHLICLGTGELENRTLIHLYVDENGRVSETQTYTGLDEYVSIYDYSNVESEEELKKAGMERLKELRKENEMSISLDDNMGSYDVGDKIGAYDNITKLRVSASVTKKLVSIKDGITSISYEVGD